MPPQIPTEPDIPSGIKRTVYPTYAREAILYSSLPTGAVRCELCRRHCVIPPTRRGFCRVRENRDGVLYTLVHSLACAWACDPIEKKPFYHFFPGTDAFSISTVGCNFACQMCQNWEISQATTIFGEKMPPEEVVRSALAYAAHGIAYTYTEPTVFFEYCYDTAKLAREKGLYNVFVTNGYMSEKAIELMDVIDASRIDLKAFSDKFYNEVCGGVSLDGVLDSIKKLHKKQHIEIITLLIPTLNDSDDEIRALAQWVRDLDPEIPQHFTAYYPAYKMRLPPTSAETLDRARKIALDVGLKYVYTGNIPGHPGEHTYCPNCGEVLVERWGFTVTKNILLRQGNRAKCPECGQKINIILKLDWMK